MVRALVVVAHPDDETIWCGGTILAHPEWQWTILSLCRGNDRDRAPKFRKACRRLGAKWAISDLEDEHPEKKLRSLDEVKTRVCAMLRKLKKGTSFDKIYTHGSNGEYGHNRHREVHRAVKEMLVRGELKANEVFFFDYKLGSRGFYCVPNRGSGGSTSVRENGVRARADNAKMKSWRESARSRSAKEKSRASLDKSRGAGVNARLSARTARTKRLLITSLYQFTYGSFEARSARATESFRVKRT